MKPDGEALARANALLDGPELFTRDQWFTLPMALRHRWWRETDYGNQPPSQSLIAEIRSFLTVNEQNASKPCPVCDGVGEHKWNCTLNR